MKALIGIGTNIGDKLKNIEDAVNSLQLVPGINVIKQSSVYDTAPWGYTAQDNFYNIVCEVETNLTPNALLGICLGIEGAMGRIRQFKNGPRIIDLDVLLYEGTVINTTELCLPHPRIGERDFVLVPMQELYKSMVVYGFDYSSEYKNIAPKSSAKIIEKN